MYSGAQQDHDHDYYVGPPLESDERKLLYSIASAGRGKDLPPRLG